MPNVLSAISFIVFYDHLIVSVTSNFIELFSNLPPNVGRLLLSGVLFLLDDKYQGF